MKEDNLKSIRDSIDLIDSDIVQLLNKRFSLICKIGDIKRQEKHPVLDIFRERMVINRVSALSEDDYREYICELFLHILEQSKQIQSDIKPK